MEADNDADVQERSLTVMPALCALVLSSTGALAQYPELIEVLSARDRPNHLSAGPEISCSPWVRTSHSYQAPNPLGSRRLYIFSGKRRVRWNRSPSRGGGNDWLGTGLRAWLYDAAQQAAVQPKRAVSVGMVGC